MNKLIERIHKVFWPTKIKQWDNLMAYQTDIVISIPVWKKVSMKESEITKLKYHLDEIKSLLL